MVRNRIIINYDEETDDSNDNGALFSDQTEFAEPEEHSEYDSDIEVDQEYTGDYEDLLIGNLF
jgi:hypothetical protein